jgi:hypothetical protein
MKKDEATEKKKELTRISCYDCNKRDPDFPEPVIATSGVVMPQTIDFITSSLFLLPSSIFLLPSSFFHLPSSFKKRETDNSRKHYVKIHQ